MSGALSRFARSSPPPWGPAATASSRTALAAAPTSSDLVIGRPTTIRVAPAAMASAGGATRPWASDAAARGAAAPGAEGCARRGGGVAEGGGLQRGADDGLAARPDGQLGQARDRLGG